MQNYLHFDYEISVATSDHERCLALKRYAAKLGFSNLIFQPAITHSSQFSSKESQRLKSFNWSTFEIEQLERYGFDQQPSFIQYVATHFKPFCFDINEIIEFWRTKSDFQSFKSIFTRRNIRYAIIVPIHLPFSGLGYSCWLSTQPYSLAPLVKARCMELRTSTLRFHDTIEAVVHPLEPSSVPSLSNKEWQCLYLASKGMTEKEMASALTRSADTVKFHLRNAAKKLSAKNRTQAVARALQMGMIKA